ncbi:TetR/AcrR family transcriptional regulator [Streptomyces sp. NPDC050560]|uniref:TetR/AcrR family transcriptional regulator n=1 Tax=Streptomyces sp. NPDC050560 TaxID=3365630 RepID=UPI0037B037B7
MTSTSGGSTARQRPRRADARRNYARILVEADKAFGRYGADASLDDIAKRAGVANATLYRHFPTREALLEQVYRDHIERLCGQALEVSASEDPYGALMRWMSTLLTSMSHYQGLTGLLALMLKDDGAEISSWCRGTIRGAAATLLSRAQEAGAVRGDIDEMLLLRVINAVSLVAAQTGCDAEEATRLLTVLVEGLHPGGPRVPGQAS